MYLNKRILAVVPARGGSKGIPLKNLHPLAGKPLLAYTAETVQQLPEIDRTVVSTDHEEIAAVGLLYGLDAPFRRPIDLSGDRVADWDVLVHALQTMEQMDQCMYDVILMLQPTCPLRKPFHVQRTYQKVVDSGYDAVWTVSQTDSKAHPLKQLILNGDLMEYYDPCGADIIARQQLQPLYHRNGAAYAITRACLLGQGSIKGRCCSAVVIEESLANIDTRQDVLFAEFLLEREVR